MKGKMRNGADEPKQPNPKVPKPKRKGQPGTVGWIGPVSPQGKALKERLEKRAKSSRSRSRSRGGWGAKAVLQACRKVVERPNSGKPTDRVPGRVVTVDEFRTSRVGSIMNSPQPCEEELDSSKPTRPEDWKPKPGQVQNRLLRSAWSQRFEAPVRGSSPVFADVEKITGLQPAQALDLLRFVLSSLNSIASAQPSAATAPPATTPGVGPTSYAGAVTAAPHLPEVGTSAAAAAADEIQRLRQQLVGVTAHLNAAQNEAVRVRAELSEMEMLQGRVNSVMDRIRGGPAPAGGPTRPVHRGTYWDVSSSSSSGGHRGSRHSSQGGGRHAGRAAQAPPATAPVCPAPAAGGSTLPIPGYACHHCWNPNHFRDYCNLKHLPAEEARRISGYPRPASLGPPSRHANPPGDLPPRSQKRDRSPPGKGGWKQQGKGDRRR
ncbi:hypothetical protein QJQ45_011452 [Haematococcus lacustris]|nr:hypothetical protein QJQ45_011452 [Haematococcus lacustris]